ncbi:MAG: hypothetical protein GX241_08135 [Ruminococcaceae bacterium]|nr:hypothetical protein [Oscillospiraceae bacterium]
MKPGSIAKVIDWIFYKGGGRRKNPRITDKFIVIDNGRYRETFLLQGPEEIEVKGEAA